MGFLAAVPGDLGEARGPAGTSRPGPSSAWRPGGARIEQAMDVDNEVAHVCVVHRTLGHGLPGLIGFGVARIDTHDIELVEVAELHLVERLELAAKDKVKQLLGGPARDICGGHDRISRKVRLPFHLSGSEAFSGRTRRCKVAVRRLLRSWQGS